ncbi:TetR/AcrR family transcriptional regulator [Roseibium denhamense]|uniref:Transcriptional regulator, TetR family n=1 Tax=Roseibium denhamense TaxID=76305 RepID=A0ABY1NRT6_9HYPH|nr:TetR/AcrR family transcriptional regulator [Roseibium denhamense]MTI08119.1 TetR/AcrR family transcriptional regulator [Roseibium denhamense]SMP16566.1 transcriptional regulator, TetR family [Roseibium denhamense]
MRPSKRDELVRKALEIFDRLGYQAAGMDTLVAETGISKTTMFKHFRTKDDLILAVLRYRDETFRNWFFKQLDESGLPPGEKLLHVFDLLEDWFGEPSFKGCMFIKASAEFQEKAHPAHVQSAEHKRLLRQAILELAGQTGVSDPELLTRQVMLLIEGAIVSAQMGTDRDPSAVAKKAARQLLECGMRPQSTVN